MDDLRYANIALDIFCIILSILPIVYLISNHRYRQKLNQFFLGACISNVFMIAGDLPDWILSMTASVLERLVLSAATALYYAASAFVLYFFIMYDLYEILGDYLVVIMLDQIGCCVDDC